jgi:hypothetical protein
MVDVDMSPMPPKVIKREVCLQARGLSKLSKDLSQNSSKHLKEGGVKGNKRFYEGAGLSQPHFEASVRMRLALPKVGTWSPPGLPQLQSSILEVKTPHLKIFFILLERP